MSTTTTEQTTPDKARPSATETRSKPTSPPPAGKRRKSGGRAIWLVLLVIALLIGGSVYAATYLFGKSEIAAMDTFTVARRDFSVVLHEKGELKAANSIDVKSEVEGRSTIIWLIEEGTEVKEGELLVKLASEEIDDRIRNEEIKESNSRAAAEAASKEYEIALDEQASNIRKAELAVENAEIELKKYLEGDWVLEKRDAALEVLKAEEVRDRKKAELQDSRELFEQFQFTLPMDYLEELEALELSDRLIAEFSAHGVELEPGATLIADEEKQNKWRISEVGRKHNIRLEPVDEQDPEGPRQLNVYFERGFVTEQDVKTDEFELLEAEIALEKAKLREEVLHKFTYPQEKQKKRSDLEEAIKELERTKKNAEAVIAKSLANKDAKAAEHEFVRQQLEEFRRQKEKTEIHAPASGLVVYHSGDRWWGNDSQVREGAEVHERQTIIRLPDTDVMKVVVRIHESKAEMVKIGQPVTVEVEGIPDVTFQGKVDKIAPLADTQRRWLNPDLKEYETEILLDSTKADLKPGATARAEILVDRVEDARVVPVQAVVSKQGRRFVFLEKGEQPEPRQVQVGASNEEFVQVLDGVESGDVIHLSIADTDMQLLPEFENQPETSAQAQERREQRKERRGSGRSGRGGGGRRG